MESFGLEAVDQPHRVAVHVAGEPYPASVQSVRVAFDGMTRWLGRRAAGPTCCRSGRRPRRWRQGRRAPSARGWNIKAGRVLSQANSARIFKALSSLLELLIVAGIDLTTAAGEADVRQDSEALSQEVAIKPDSTAPQRRRRRCRPRPTQSCSALAAQL